MFTLQERLEKWLFESPPANPWPDRGMRILRYAYALVRDFIHGDLNLRAMSLVYTTLLSVVPLLAFGFAVLKGFGVHQEWERFIYDFFRPLGSKAGELTDRVMGFVENTSGGALGALGVAFLLYTVISAIQKIEGSFNFVWRVERPRSLARRVSEYLAVMVIGPVLVVAAVGLTASLADEKFIVWLTNIHAIDSALVFLSRFVPYVVVSLLFAFLYIFIPNTRVRVRAAMIGGLFAGALWALLGAAFTTFVSYATQLSVIYAGFFVVVTSLIWIYIAWLILLFGAQMSFYVQHPECMRRGQIEPRLTASLTEQLALNAMYLIAKSFKTGEPGWTLNRLSERLDVSGTLLGPVIRSLEGAGLLAVTEQEILLPGRDIAEINLSKIVDAARRYHKGEPVAHVRGTPPAQKLASEIDTALHERLEGRSLRALLDGE